MTLRFILPLLILPLPQLVCSGEAVVQGEPVLVQGTKEPAGFPFPAQTTITLGDARANPGMEGISGQAANFFATSNGAHSFNDTFALRGLTNTPLFGEPAVSFYLDDIPVGGAFTTPDFFAGLAQAVLHRGPGMNTRYGQAGSAGVIQLTTPADKQTPMGFVSIKAGNFKSRETSAQANAEQSSQLSVFAAGRYAKRDGYIYNQTIGTDIDHRESTEGLVRVHLSSLAPVQISLVAQAARAHDGEQPLVPLQGPLFTSNRQTIGKTSLSTFNAGATAAVAAPWGKISVTSSVNNWKLGPYRSVLAFGPFELINDVRLIQRIYNEELRVSSSTNGNLQWQSGLFFAKSSTEGGFTRAFGPYTRESSTYEIQSTKLAAYGETLFALDSTLQFTAGVRVESVRKSLDRIETVPMPQSFSLSRDSTALLPKIGLVYLRNQEFRLFASTCAGFKPGGFSAFTGNRALASFRPERSVGFECGISQSIPHRTWSWTATMFDYDISGYQIERSFATTSVSDDYLVVNAQKARSLGAEFEFTWQPIPNLSLTSGFGLTKVTLRNFTDPYTGKIYDGKRAPYVPLYDLSVSCEYKAASGWFGSIEWTANGRTHYTESEDISFTQRAYHLLAASIGYTWRNWTMLAYVQNALDKRYYSAISAGTGHGSPGAPRIGGIELRRNF